MIYVNGDSFSQRSKIETDYSWPSILATKTGQQVINQSIGCGSNSRMLSNLLNLHSLNIKPDLVIIALSSHRRWHLPAERFGAWNIGPTIINDRTGQEDQSILKWWLVNVYDQIEFVRQYYNQIWQMHEFCKLYLNCPIIFFNSIDREIKIFEARLFGDVYQQHTWINSRVKDKSDIFTQDYKTVFNFYKKESQNWLRDSTPWLSLLPPEYIDPENGEHPYHPSRQGHVLLCDYVLSKIKESLPELYHKWSIN